MPITLSCTACAKPFRARDESAGKKVKCPYCQTPVVVPSPDGAPPDAPPPSRPGASRADLPLPPMSRPGASRAEVALPPPAPKIASPDDWGTAPPEPPAPLPAPAPAPMPAPFPVAGADRPRPRPAKSALTADERAAEEALAQGWNSVRRGLGWVRFGLLFVALLGFVELGKAGYVMAKGPLPAGDGAEWVSIEGFVNSAGEGGLRLSKEQLLDLAAYGAPLVLGLLCIALGRLIASGAPRASGAKGLFALSCLLTLVWFALPICAVCFAASKPLVSKYTGIGFVIAFPLTEFLFLVAVTACGLALKRPGAAKAVGFFGFLLALAAVAVTIGLELYAQHARPQLLTPEYQMGEAGVFAAVWVVLVFAYRSAAGVVRRAAREFVEAAEDNAAA